MDIEEIKAALAERDAAVMDSVKDVTGRLDQIELRMNRPGTGGAGDQFETRQVQQEIKAFANFLRHGPDGVSAEERKSLSMSPDTAGGYLSPEHFQRELLRNIVEFSPVRQVARVANMGSHTAVLPKRTGTLTGAWVGETAARPSSEPTYGQAEYPAREMAVYVDVSNHLLEDSQFDIAAELARDFSEEFGRLEGAAFVNGSTPLEPAGFMQNDDIASTNSGSASTVADANGQADGIIDLFFALPAVYRSRATWAMNSTTLAAVAKLKDADNNYIVSRLADSPEQRILGRPVIEFPDMPDEAAGAFPIIVGDFMSGYRIFDRLQLSVLRDPYSQATNGMTRFHARRRVAGGVGKAEALRKLKVAS